MNIVDLLARSITRIINWASRRAHLCRLRAYPSIASSASVGIGTTLIGPEANFRIGAHTYLNGAHLSCGPDSCVVIGTGCAIGYNVSIKAITHDMNKPTRNDDGPVHHIEKDIVIGNDCWIGDNVFIREGVVLGDRVVVGANSVVTKSFLSNQVIAGAPARVIREH